MNTFRTCMIALLGLLAWTTAGAEEALAPLSPEALLALAKSGERAPLVIDVRTPDEYVAGHVPGAVNIPHEQIAARLTEIPRDRDVVLYCRSGRRAGMAGQTLAENGYTRLQHLEGDMAGWEQQQRPTEVPRDPAACAEALKAGKTGDEACVPL